MHRIFGGDCAEKYLAATALLNCDVFQSEQDISHQESFEMIFLLTIKPELVPENPPSRADFRFLRTIGCNTVRIFFLRHFFNDPTRAGPLLITGKSYSAAALACFRTLIYVQK